MGTAIDGDANKPGPIDDANSFFSDRGEFCPF